jgi:hypothetical protein
MTKAKHRTTGSLSRVVNALVLAGVPRRDVDAFARRVSRSLLMALDRVDARLSVVEMTLGANGNQRGT